MTGNLAVEVLRDPKMMIARRAVATAKLLRHSYLYGAFFGGYHGLRKALHVAFPKNSAEGNLAAAGVLSLIPLGVLPLLRHMFPYGVMLIALDAVNGLHDL